MHLCDRKKAAQTRNQPQENRVMIDRRTELHLLQKDLAKKIGISPAYVSHIETLRIYPHFHLQEKIAEILKLPTRVLFPKWLQEYQPPVTHEEEMPTWRLSIRIASPDPSIESLFEQSSLRDDMQRLLSMLTPREKEVLELRFGLKDDRPKTTQEVGMYFGLTSDRIRQIELRAMIRLRHAIRKYELHEYLT